MTDVWRSTAKKYCNLCKCWFYDNIVSIQHHERGKRHKQNVEDKIRELSKKGREKEKIDKETVDALSQMEIEALRSYKNDLKNELEIADNYDIHLNLAPLPLKTPSDGGQKEKQPKLNVKPGVSTKWREIFNAEVKQSYFWNTETNETRWDVPEEGYLSLDEQEIEREMSAGAQYPSPSLIADYLNSPENEEEEFDENKHNSAKYSNDNESEESRDQDEEEDDDDDGPGFDYVQRKLIKPKKRPFGDWKVVEEEEIEEKPSTFGISTKNGDAVSKKVKFEEKKFPTVSTSATNKPIGFKPLKNTNAAGGTATFKKPKSAGNRNLRNRDDDDD